MGQLCIKVIHGEMLVPQHSFDVLRWSEHVVSFHFLLFQYQIKQNLHMLIQCHKIGVLASPSHGVTRIKNPTRHLLMYLRVKVGLFFGPRLSFQIFYFTLGLRWHCIKVCCSSVLGNKPWFRLSLWAATTISSPASHVFPWRHAEQARFKTLKIQRVTMTWR